ncbi:MAG: metallophosphoesterase [Pseudomonadota bacterium]
MKSLNAVSRQCNSRSAKAFNTASGFSTRARWRRLCTTILCLPLSLAINSTSFADNPSSQASSSGPGYFLHLSDVHLDTYSDTTTYGGDTGRALWADTQAKLGQVLMASPKPEFIVYTGDLPAHYHCPDNRCYLPPGAPRTDHNTNIATILNNMRSVADAAGVPLFYSPGNNDSLGGDYFSFTTDEGKPKTPIQLSPSQNNPYPALNTAASCGSAPCIVSNAHPQFGYYSVRPVAGLRIVALNSIILGHTYHSRDGTSQTEAGNQQMDWMESELLSAKNAGEKVWLIMHIPPGLDAYAVNSATCPTSPTASQAMWAHLPRQTGNQPVVQWLDRFISAVETYQPYISGVLYGHTHMDEVRRIYGSDNQTITAVALSAPGITPQHYNNPGFKVVSYDTASKEFLNAVTHYRTLSDKTWSTYDLQSTFGCTTGSTLFDCFKGQSLGNLNTDMDKVFTVMNGDAGYNTSCGIEVRPGQ